MCIFCFCNSTHTLRSQRLGLTYLDRVLSAKLLDVSHSRKLACWGFAGHQGIHYISITWGYKSLMRQEVHGFQLLVSTLNALHVDRDGWQRRRLQEKGDCCCRLYQRSMIGCHNLPWCCYALIGQPALAKNDTETLAHTFLNLQHCSFGEQLLPYVP